MKWLGLSLMVAGYQAEAHIIWDSADAGLNLEAVLKGLLRHDEPIFLYLGDRPMLPPVGHYWWLMSEYPTLWMYQLEAKDE